MVSVYEYQPEFGADDNVNFRVMVYFDSFAPDGALPVPLEDVAIFIEKDTSGSNLANQTIEIVESETRPGYSQGYGLKQGTGTSSTYEDRVWWGLQALAFGVGLFLEPVDVAMDLIDLAGALIPSGEDYDNAYEEDSRAMIWWSRGGWDLGLANPIRQYCLNSLKWFQDRVNPSVYFGLKIKARLTINSLWWSVYPDILIDTPPIYLRIYPNLPPETPSTPSGNTSGYVGHTCTYSTSTTDPDGDMVQYEFDWGDGTILTTGSYASGATATASHSWSSPGTYSVTVRALDSKGACSDWSSSLAVNILEYHDVAVTSVTFVLPYEATAVYPEWVINVSVTVQNQGDYTETFNVTAYANSIIIETKTVTSLAPGQTTTLTFVWTVPTPPAWTPYPPHYAISAEAEAVPGETDNSDNMFVDNSVTVKHIGDVDGDGDVDADDYWLFSGGYGSQYGDPNYDPNCDFDGDGDVDPDDYYLFSAAYGWQA